MSALPYSREALRQARERRAAPAPADSLDGAAPKQQLSIFDEVPQDTPMPAELTIAYWADWRGEFVSREVYLGTIPINRLIDADAVNAARAPAAEPAAKGMQPKRQTLYGSNDKGLFE